MIATAARPTSDNRAHWYQRDGTPMHTMIGKTTGRPRPTDIRDARRLDLLPSVTSILQALHKEGLVLWRIEQAVLACLTTPRRPAELDDDFVYRVLHTDRVQDEERNLAASFGTRCHDAMDQLMRGKPFDPLLGEWVGPAYEHVISSGLLMATEKRLVGKDYAGTADILLRCQDPQQNQWRIWDYKFTKNLPDPKKGAWPEHQLQLSAYGRAWLDSLPEDEKCRKISVGNLYVSTTEPGKFVVCETQDWFRTYEEGFRPLVQFWKWQNNL